MIGHSLARDEPRCRLSSGLACVLANSGWATWYRTIGKACVLLYKLLAPEKRHKLPETTIMSHPSWHISKPLWVQRLELGRKHKCFLVFSYIQWAHWKCLERDRTTMCVPTAFVAGIPMTLSVFRKYIFDLRIYIPQKCKQQHLHKLPWVLDGTSNDYHSMIAYWSHKVIKSCNLELMLDLRPLKCPCANKSTNLFLQKRKQHHLNKLKEIHHGYLMAYRIVTTRWLHITQSHKELQFVINAWPLTLKISLRQHEPKLISTEM